MALISLQDVSIGFGGPRLLEKIKVTVTFAKRVTVTLLSPKYLFASVTANQPTSLSARSSKSVTFSSRAHLRR